VESTLRDCVPAAKALSAKWFYWINNPTPVSASQKVRLLLLKKIPIEETK
jgi:hypothetical protein